MTSSKPHSENGSGVPSDIADAFEACATAVAGGIAGALCTGLAWRLGGSIFDALMGSGETQPNRRPGPVPLGGATFRRRPPLHLARSGGGRSDKKSR